MPPKLFPNYGRTPISRSIFGEVADKNFDKNIREAELERLSARDRSSLEILNSLLTRNIKELTLDQQ